VAISTAFCYHPTGPLEKNSLLRCDSVSDKRVTGEGSLAIVKISEEGVYVEMAEEVAAVEVAAVDVAAVEAAAVEVAALEVAALEVAAVEEAVVEVALVVVALVVVALVVASAEVVAAVVVTASGVESMLVAAVVVAKHVLKSMASLGTAAMSLIDVNVVLVVGRWLWLRWQYWAQVSVCRRR